VNHLMPANVGTLLRSRALSLRSKAEFVALLARVRRSDPRTLEGRSVDEWIAERQLRPDGDAVLRALVRLATYASDLRTFAADAAVQQIQTALRGGVLYLDGGWTQLVDALSAQVEVRPRSVVRSIEPAGGRVEVTTHDLRCIARAVIVAAGRPDTMLALLPGDPGWGSLGDEVTAACLDAGVSRVPRPGYVVGADDPVYVTTQAPPARQAPAGQAVVAAVRYGATKADQDRPLLERYLAEAGVAPSDVVTSRFLARLTVAGAAPVATAGGLPARPPVTASGTPGVFIAGDWVGPDGLIGDAALASGHAAGLSALRTAARATTMIV
jgi:phytoene dehydrogenase-like protein